MDQAAMYKLSYGLFVLTSSFGGKESGCIINTAGQVTVEPNRISIAVSKSNFTHDLVRDSGKFNLSVLSQDADFEIFRHFGFQSGRTVDKFADYAHCQRSPGEKRQDHSGKAHVQHHSRIACRQAFWQWRVKKVVR